MDCTNVERFKGAGQVLVAHRTSSGIDGAWIPLGDTDSFEINTDRSYGEHRETCSGNRNLAERWVDTTSITLDVNSFDFSKESLERALLGKASTVSGATVTGEAFTLFGSGNIICLTHPDVSSVVVKNTAGSTTLVAGTDYTLSANDGVIVVTSTGLAKLTVSGSNKTGIVDYTYASYDKVEANTEIEQEYTFKLIGLNVLNGESVIVTVHRVQMSPAQTLSLIGDAPLSTEMSGLIKADSTQGSGKSQYYNIVKTK